MDSGSLFNILYTPSRPYNLLVSLLGPSFYLTFDVAICFMDDMIKLLIINLMYLLYFCII